MPRTCAKQPSLIFENDLYEFIKYRPILLVIWWIPAAGLFCNENEKIIIPDNHNKWFPTYSSMKMEMYSKVISHFEGYLHSGCFEKEAGKEKWWQNGRFKGWIDRLAVPSCERHGGPAETDLAHFQRQQLGGWRSSWYWSSALFLVLPHLNNNWNQYGPVFGFSSISV